MSVSTLILTSIFSFAISRRYVRNQKEEEVLPILTAVESLWIDYSLGEIDHHSFERFLMSQSMMNNAQLVLIDTQGNLIYASLGIKDDRIADQIELIDVSNSKIFLEILASNEVYSKTLEIEGSRFPSIVVGKVITLNDRNIGAVAMIVPVFELDRSATSLILALILSFSFVSVFMIGVLYLFSKRLTKPLISMSEVALALSSGNFEAKADEKDPSEIGVLGHSLNEMSSKLKETLSQVNFERSRLEAMLKSMKEGLVSIDLDGNIILTNSALFELLDIETQNQLSDILASETINKHLSLNKSTSFSFDHQDKSILVSVSPLLLKDGTSFGLIALFMDQSEAMRLEKLRRDYVANVSHELRTPLTAIRALVDPLNDQLIKDESKKLEYYQHILKEIDRLNRLINDLLELSRLQNQQASFAKAYFDVDGLMMDLKDRFMASVLEKGLSFEVDVQGVQKQCFSNEDRIDQILSILIDNALKFTTQGSIRLKAYQKDHLWVFEVCDTGIGISKKDMPYIFDRFYTVDQARTHKSFGLGLSIAKELADHLDLKLEYESKEAQGSCFRVVLEEAN